jgi:hypothetical protein
MNSIKLISSIVFFSLLNHFAIGQDKKINLGLDTLSIKEILRIHSDYAKIKIDSVQVELFYKGERFAVIPSFLRGDVSRKYVRSTECKIEHFCNNKILLRIQENMIFK